MYQIERQNQLYKTLPHALLFNPTIAISSALTLLLPLSGVFAPGSLTVTTKNSTDVGPCMVPTGNISAQNTPDNLSLFNMGGPPGPASITPSMTPKLAMLITQWLVQRIPDLPQACGPNCRYKVHMPSLFYQCTQNPSSLLYGQGGNSHGNTTLWNGTVGPNGLDFYIAWQSNGPNGTWGNASCTPFQAQYDVEVRIITLSTSLSGILKMLTQGPDERRCPIYYDEHHPNGFSPPRHEYTPRIKPWGPQARVVAEVYTHILCNTGTFTRPGGSRFQSALEYILGRQQGSLRLPAFLLEKNQCHTINLGRCLEGYWRDIA